MTWGEAFVLTQLFEMPVFLLAMRGTPLSVPWRLAVAFGASALTHPIVWFVFYPLLLEPAGWTVFFVVAESFAFLAEAAYLRHFGVPRPVAVAFAANAWSATLGLVIAPWL